MMPGRFFRWLALALCLLAPGARAETLPLPDNLTDLNSVEGERFFLESGAHAAYFPIADNFVTQKTQAYCGVASIVMVLNAVGAPAPAGSLRNGSGAILFSSSHRAAMPAPGG